MTISISASNTNKEGAATMCYVASNAALAETTGAYFEDCNAVTVQGCNYLYDAPMAEKLVQISAQITAPHLFEQQAPARDNLLDNRGS